MSKYKQGEIVFYYCYPTVSKEVVIEIIPRRFRRPLYVTRPLKEGLSNILDTIIVGEPHTLRKQNELATFNIKQPYVVKEEEDGKSEI